MTQSAISINRRDCFLTGSQYIGQSNELGMQEYGTYVYPDGTRYCGDFKNNRFHGEGSIVIPDPEGVIFNVTHHHGRLVSIDHIEFKDNLKVVFEMKKDQTIGFKQWTYCTPKDRRFHGEKEGTLEPVGPNSFKTKAGPIPPKLGHNTFDLGFGHLTKQGFMLDTKEYSTQSFYLGCRGVRRWIRENCRHGELVGQHLKQNVKARFTREIIRNNVRESGCNQMNSIPPGRICRRSASVDSFKTHKSTRVHLASTTDSSCPSELELTQKRE